MKNNSIIAYTSFALGALALFGATTYYAAAHGPQNTKNGIHPYATNANTEVVAEVLGMTVDGVEAALEDGATIRELLEQQNIDQETFQTAMHDAHVSALKERLATQVADGDITQEEADARLERMENMEGMGLRIGRGQRGMFGGPVDHLEILSTVTGLSTDELEAAREAGKTIQDILAEQNIDQETFQTAMHDAHISALKERLATQVADGDITQEEADTRLERMENMEGVGKTEMRGMRQGFGKHNR